VLPIGSQKRFAVAVGESVIDGLIPGRQEAIGLLPQMV
jgi:hypothetical protein